MIVNYLDPMKIIFRSRHIQLNLNYITILIDYFYKDTPFNANRETHRLRRHSRPGEGVLSLLSSENQPSAGFHLDPPPGLGKCTLRSAEMQGYDDISPDGFSVETVD